LGARFAVTRLLIDIPGIVLIGYILNKIASGKEIEKMYENAREMGA
jgi:hypothetical protein